MPFRSPRSTPLVNGALCTVLACTLAMCGKDQGNVPASGSDAAAYDPVPRIKAFLAKAEHTGTAKTGAMLGTDSTVWYVEAALNHGTTNPTGEFDAFTLDSAMTVLPLDEAGVAETDALAAYLYLGAALTAQPLADGHEVVAIDVRAETDGGQLVLKTYRLNGATAKTLNTSYASNQYFRSRSISGQSCGCSGYSTATCGDRMVQNRVNQEILVPVTPGMYLTNVQMWNVTPMAEVSKPGSFLLSTFDYPNPDYTGSGYRQYRLFHWWCFDFPNQCEPCLAPADMSFFTAGTYNTMVAVRNAYCPGRQLVKCSVIGDRQGDYPAVQYFHNVYYTYGNYYNGSPS